MKTGIDVRNASLVDIDLSENHIQADDLGIAARLCSGNQEFKIENNYIEVGFEGTGMEGILVDDVAILPFNAASVSANQVEMGYCAPGTSIRGIGINLTNNLSVTENQVQLYEPQSATSDETFGISITECAQMRVNCNDVNSFGLLGYLNKAIAFESTNQAIVRCNNSDKTGSGFVFNLTNNDFDFAGNTIREHFYGLQILSSSVLAPFGAAAGQKHSFKGNEWWFNPYDADNPNLFGALHEGNDQNVQLSSFEVFPDYSDDPATLLDPEPWSAPNAPFTLWFDVPQIAPTEEDGCNFDCSSSGFVEPSPEVTKLDEYIAQEKSLWDTAYTGAKWDAHQYLFAKLRKDTTLIEDTTSIDTFFRNAQQSNLVDFWEVTEGIKAIRLPSHVIADQYGVNSVDVLSDLDTLFNIEAQWNNADSVTKASLAIQRNSLFDTLEVKINNQNNYLAGELSLLQSTIGTAALLNNGISSISTPEWNEREINDLFLSTVGNGVYTFTGAQLSTLENIAFQCPYVGGKAVYRARALYRLVIDTTFNNQALCNLAAPNGKDFNEELEDGTGLFKVFPNPAQHQVTITSDASETEHTMLFTLYDQLGRAVKSFKLEKGRQNWELDISDVAEGVYILSSIYPKEVVWNEVLIIGK